VKGRTTRATRSPQCIWILERRVVRHSVLDRRVMTGCVIVDAKRRHTEASTHDRSPHPQHTGLAGRGPRLAVSLWRLKLEAAEGFDLPAWRP
jgi:hypothetical protein